MSVSPQSMEGSIPAGHEFEVMSCGNLLYVRKGFVDAQTTIISLTDDSTKQEYHSNNNMYLYGDSWYCFELKEHILVGRTFTGVFMVRGEEHAFRGKAVNFIPKSEETIEKKTSSRLKTLVPTVVLAVLVIVFAIVAWRSEPSAPEEDPLPQKGGSESTQTSSGEVVSAQSGDKDIGKKDESSSQNKRTSYEEIKNGNETANPVAEKIEGSQLKNQAPDPKTEESPNTISTNAGNTQQGKKNALVGFLDASKEKAQENKGSDSKPPSSVWDNDHLDSKPLDKPSENSGDTGERAKEQQFVWNGDKAKTVGNNGNERHPTTDTQGNGEETKPQKLLTKVQQKIVSDVQKEPQRSEPEKVFVPQKTQEPPPNVDDQTVKGPTKPEKVFVPPKPQEPPPNVDVQTVKGPTKPKYATLPTSQNKLRDNAIYSITNNTDITNLDKIANSGRKDITLVFCPDRYGTKSKDDYTDKWENFTSKVNDMIDGTIKEVKVIKPYRSDFEIPNKAALKEGIGFEVEELK